MLGPILMTRDLWIELYPGLALALALRKPVKLVCAIKI